jgi:colanic acid biosynthesis glycosyl transferase WcaI
LLKRRGHSVTVLTGMPNYPDGVIPPEYRGSWRKIEWLDGIRVVRTAVYPAPNRGFGKRLINHTSFALSSLSALRAVGPTDVIYAETPPLFTAAAAVVIARGLKARLLLNVSDLWPESAVQLGMLNNRFAIRLAELIERFAYRFSDTVTVPTPGMRRILLDRGYGEDKVKLLPNAVDTDRFSHEPSTASELCRAMYCGTVGLAQGVGTLLAAAELLERDHAPIEVIVVGDGAERVELEDQARRSGLKRVSFEGSVSRDEVPQRIASANLTIMTLRDLPLFEDALPTKLLEYMAAGRPVVAGASGQAARLLEEVGAGIACPPENPEALAEAISRLASDPKLAQEMGARGRQYVDEHLSRRAMVGQLEAELEAIAAGPAR